MTKNTENVLINRADLEKLVETALWAEAQSSAESLLSGAEYPSPESIADQVQFLIDQAFDAFWNW